MDSLFKKLFSTSILVGLSTTVNFFSSLLIVKFLSIEIFGNYAIFTSVLAFGGLIYTIIPPNYSIFKLQDDPNFKVHLIRFFILSSIIFLPFATITHFFLFEQIPVLIIFFFGITTYWLNFFDIKYQASGKIQEYFVMLLILSLVKVMLILIFYLLEILDSLPSLLLCLTLSQGIILLRYLSMEIKLFEKSSATPLEFIKTIQFIQLNFKTFTPYYLNTVIKRIRENLIILIFSRLVSAETMGIFALFIKIDALVFGLSRNIEALFMNRTNIKQLKLDFYRKALFFAAPLQILYLVVGIIYMKTMTDDYFLIQVTLSSILIYPHVYFLMARAELLSQYNNKESNISEFIYISIVIMSYFYVTNWDWTSINMLLTSYILAKLGLQSYMIIKSKKSI